MAKLQRVGPDHPEVCQGNTGNGPCSYKREDGSLHCSLHGGGMMALHAEKRELKNYRLNAAYGQRAGQLANSPAIKNLTDEIALMRTALEVVFNSISNPNEMLLYVEKIEKLTKGIQGLITSLQNIQEKNKELLSRDVVMTIFDQILEKIVLHIGDQPDIIRKLAEECYDVITKQMGG